MVWRHFAKLGVTATLAATGLAVPPDSTAAACVGALVAATPGASTAHGLASGKRLLSVSARATDDVWTVGYSADGGKLTPLVEHWDGAAWSEVPTPDLGTRARLNAVQALSPTDVWAVGISNVIDGPDGIYGGRTLVEHWDGTAWVRVQSVDPSPVETNELTALTVVAPNDIWAVGYRYYEDEEGPVTLSEHWNGRKWRWVKSRISASGDRKLLAAASTSSSDVWAVGFEDSDIRIQHWDGAGWSAVSAPDGTGPGYGVAAISPTDAWIVGSTQTLHWDGETWSAVDNAGLGTLLAVSANGTSDVWAVAGHRIGHWTGSRWKRVKSPRVGSLSGVSALNRHNAWAVGHDGPDPLIEHWDGERWSVSA